LKNGYDDAVVIVDPMSTGAKLAFDAAARGYKVIRVLSPNLPEKIVNCFPEDCRGLVFCETLYFDDENPSKTAAELQALPYHIVAAQCGCESGVESYDALVNAMTGFAGNTLEFSGARRDKYMMGERIRECKLRAVKQIEVREWAEEAQAFLAELRVREDDPEGAWCVLKPTKSAGSDGVYIAKTIGEATEAFQRILGAADVFGEVNQTVLMQEFLKGKEYVVDSVSMEGEHKCVAIWEYDKRPTNGAAFVYYGMKLYQSEDGERERKMVEYMHGVLDALGVKHGPTHGECMWLDDHDEPCLIEVGSRPHGGEGTFAGMAQCVLGYSQVSVMLDTFDKPQHFRRLPKQPARFSGHCQELYLVSLEDGDLEGYPMMEVVKQLPSYNGHNLSVQPGGKIQKTIDFLTTPGSIRLMHDKDGSIVVNDAEKIHQMALNGTFYKLAPKDAMLKLASPNLKTL